MLHIVLYQPEIPHNTGNIGRTCVALGARLWIVRPCGFRLDDQRLRRAGLDYWEHLQWDVVANWEALTAELPERRYWLFTRHARRSFWEISFADEDVLVFGSESQGLPAGLLSQSKSDPLRIPTTDQVRSLNLSNAVAIAAYEWARQLA